MRKSSKLIMCLVLVVAMLMQLATVSFAAVSTTTIGAVSYKYDAETKTYTASVSARGLDKEAMLVIAEYDAQGNVKASAVSRTAENATEGVLTASVTVSDEANEVKAFVWDKDYAPFNMDTVLGVEYTEDDVELYFNDVDFATAIGEEMAFDSEYTYVLPLNEGNFNLPDISYEINDSTIDVDIATDGDAMQTVITFEAGERTETAVLDTNVSGTTYYKATRYEYSKPWVHTVTINYVLPETGGYITNAMTENRTGVNGMYGGGNDAKYDYVMEYTLPEDKEYQTISFKADSFTNQYSIVIIEALEAETKGTDAVVNVDGTPTTWLTDNGVVAGYDYTLEGDARIDEPWDASRVTWGEYAMQSSVELKGATTDGGSQITYSGGGTHFRLARKMQESDGYFVSGSRIAEGSRDPSYQKVQYTEVPDSLLGYNYITCSGANNMFDMTVSMTVNQDVKLHFISTGTGNGITTLNSDGTDNAKITATNLGTDDFRREYLNTAIYDAFSYAYHVVNSNLDESILLRTSSVTQKVTKDGTTYAYPNDVYVLRNWAKAREIVNSNPYGKYLLPEYIATSGIGTTVDGTTVTLDKKTVAEYVALWKDINGVEPLISTPEIVTGHVYNGTAVTYPVGLRPVVKEWNGADTNRSIFSDRAGAEQPRHTGMIVSYPEVFDLEDSTFITTAVKYGDGGEGDRTMYNMYGNIAKLEDYEPYPLYSFTVSKDCEVLIFSNNKSHAYLGNTANGWTKSVLTEGIKYVHVSNAVAEDAAESVSVPHLFWLYRKTFAPGDTVTMYTPGNTETVFIPFIKEIDVDHSSDAASITVDGVEIEGFDKDVETYTYNINNVTAETLPVVAVTPADPTTEVEITYNKSYEAPSAKAVLTSIDGKETIYTINFTNVDAEVTNLYLCTEGNVIPAKYLAEGTTADYTSKLNASYLKKGFALGMDIWADRTYKVTEVLDESLVGKDVIRSRVGWWNAASNPEYTAYRLNAASGKYIPWINFKTTRSATVMIFKTTNANASAFTSYGFSETANSGGYFKIVRDSNAVNTSKYMYAKDVAAGELVTVPNDYEGSNSYTIIIKYADYK